MPYFSKDTIFKAIDELSNTQYIGGRQNGSPNTIPIYLFLSRFGGKLNDWIEYSKLFENEELVSLTIYQLGGMFDFYHEVGESTCCLFFSHFFKRPQIRENDFFNKATHSRRLFSRMPDTLDNSIIDYIADVVSSSEKEKKKYRLKKGYINIIKRMYSQPFSLDALIIWLYRTHEFTEQCSNIKQIREYFYQDYHIDCDDAQQLFNLQQLITIEWDENITHAQEYRKYLNIENLVKVSNIESSESNISEKPKLSIYFEQSYLNKYMKLDENKLYTLLEKHKQLILTGVPGTGKSFLIDQLSAKYKETVKIQFHQNYSYQDFVIGKTIKNNSVEYVEGILIQLLRKIEQDKKNKEKHKYLLVIDEINRGNISAIFGELLYALDRDKTINIILGDSGDTYPIFIPENLHIVGTMNTADRSIALVDFAIRRRFLFIEMQPDYELIDQLSIFNNQHLLGDFLQKINNNIKNYFNTEDYQIGHSYFIQTLDTKDKIYNWTSEDLYEIIQYKIIPMLVEYAHGDKSVIPNILGKKIYLTSPSELEESI